LNGGALPADRIPKVSERLTGLQAKFRQPIERKMGRMDDRIAKLQGRIDGGNLNEAQMGRVTDRLGRVQGRRDRVGALLNPYEQAAATTPEPTTPYPAETPAPQPNYQERIDGFMQAMFPQTSTYNTHEYMKNALQPARDLAQSEGERSLNRYLAAKGLTKSGAALESLNELSTKTNADWSNRAATLASEDAQRRQQNAERVRGWLTDAADRTERGEQNAFDNRFAVLETMLDQGNRTMDRGYGAATNIAGFEQDRGKSVAGMKANEYMGMPPMGAFPMGHSATPQYVPSFPTQPDFSAANNAANWGNYSSSNDWLGGMSDLFSIGASLWGGE
jgi:hypothetical protein